MQKSIRSRKFTPRVSPKKLKTLFVTGKNDVLKTLSQVFLWEHEIPLVTNLLICNTRQTLVEWDFSTTNKTTKVDMQTKIGPPPYGLGPLQTNSPENYTVVMLPVTVCFISPSYCVAARYKSILASSSWWWLEIVLQSKSQYQQVPGQDIPSKFSSNKGTQPWASRYRLPKVTPKP